MDLINKLDKYLDEMSLTSKEQTELEQLKKSQRQGKITKMGLKRLSDLEDREYR
jgi:hypothetical protein